ncbi:hypothetical protein [Streptomyces sp900116325]|uniref:hypothetical protein n=1 Tax=Streptomyces sp. 900116325 TaxID=3154295 RepID=UPI0033AC7D88
MLDSRSFELLNARPDHQGSTATPDVVVVDPDGKTPAWTARKPTPTPRRLPHHQHRNADEPPRARLRRNTAIDGRKATDRNNYGRTHRRDRPRTGPGGTRLIVTASTSGVCR